jgi:hypothetical protein
MADVALPILKDVTPVLTGALRDSERIDSVDGNGAFAVAFLQPHIIYAEFRNNGGIITAKRFRQLGNPEVGFFGKTVHQSGSHYIERAEADGRAPCRAAAAQVAAFYFTL